ncbi:hypothetical protein BGZ92_009067 [Podila epicladia]|nr:hypothetical protein BGZ92_009067 [Podila epicladia]
MSSGRKKGARGNNISPSSSPPLPPPPSQAQSNRGSAAPYHSEAALAKSVNLSGSRSPKTSRAKQPSTTPSTAPTTSSVPSGHATRNNLTTSPQQHEVVVIRKRGKLRRWIARILLIYLSYTFVFICPRLPNQKSNQVCDAFVHVQDWLRPYTEPVAMKIDETYRNYAEPLVDQYGRPMYQQSQQYYSDYAQPAFKTASVKAKANYNQYAHPHIVKAYEALYTDDVKAHVHKAQNHLHHYQKQAYDQLEFIKHKSKAANDHMWHLHKTHVHPVVEKVSPHAKVAWEKASLGAHRLYNDATVLYLTHVNPYAHDSWIYIQEAIDQAGDVVTKKADEIWGTSLHKAHQARKKARVAKAHAKAHVKESFKDTLLRKASEAQKAAGAYSETLKAAVMGDKAKAHAKAHTKGHDIKGAATEKGHQAQKMAQDFVETVSETVAKKAHEAQKIVIGEAEYMKKLADDKVHEAGKVSDKIKKTVVEKAREAHEAVARKAESIRHSVVDAVHGAEEAVEHEMEHLQKTVKDKKSQFEKMAKEEANVIKHAAEKKEKEAEKAFKDASGQIHKAYEAAEHEAETIKAKAVKAGHDAEKGAREHVMEAQHVVEEQLKHAQDVAHEDAEWIQKKVLQAAKDASKAAEGAKHAVEDTIKHARKTAEEDAAWIQKMANQASMDATKAAENAKHTVEDAIKHAREVAQDDAEWIKDSAQHVFKDASKGAKDAKDAEHAAEHQAKAAQKAAQDSTHSARKHAQDAKHAVRDQIHKAHDAIYESMDMAGQIVMSGKEQADEQIKGASVKVEKAKDAATHKAHDAHMASKVALAAMLAGIEKTFSQFYHYEETETKNLWNKLQSAIDEHIESAKKSAHELEKANKETFESFEGYVKSWASESGSLEERLAKLGQQQVDSIKKIGQRTETHQGAGKSKAQILTNNVDVYITGLRDFLSERLAAARETVASELGVFKDTSSAHDEHQAREKLVALEQGAREKLKTAGKDARDKAHELLKQIEEIWAQSEAKSKEYVQRTRDLAATAGEEAKLAIQGTKEPKGPKKAKGVVDETEPDVRVAPEEPGSGHRHHRH